MTRSVAVESPVYPAAALACCRKSYTRVRYNLEGVEEWNRPTVECIKWTTKEIRSLPRGRVATCVIYAVSSLLYPRLFVREARSSEWMHLRALILADLPLNEPRGQAVLITREPAQWLPNTRSLDLTCDSQSRVKFRASTSVLKKPNSIIIIFMLSGRLLSLSLCYTSRLSLLIEHCSRAVNMS